MLPFHVANTADYSDCTCSTARATIQEQYDKLIRLPVDSLLPTLYANGVITFDQKIEIEDIPQKIKKTQFILNLIISSLINGRPTLYNRFLKVMEESENVDISQFAKNLGKLKQL